MRKTLMIGALATFALVSPAQGAMQSGAEFMARMQEAASSVPPLRMREGTPTAILPGFFRNSRRADAVVIYEDNASLCRGPDYKKCLPLGNLPATGTVATTIHGESKLLVFDSMSSARVCDIDVADHRASMDCKTVNFNQLAAYNIKLLAAGQILMIEGTDGTYFCSAGKNGLAKCGQITTADGTSAVKKTHAERRAFGGGVFQPLDQPEKRCLVRAGAIHCTDRQKLSDFIERPLQVGPRMRPVLILEENDYGTVDVVLGRVEITARYDPGGGLSEGYWGANGHRNYTTGGGGGYGIPVGSSIAEEHFPPPRYDPRYYQQQCLAICAQQDADFGNVCKGAAAFYLVFGAPAAAAAFLVCEAARAYHDHYCRNGLCGR